MRGYDCETSGTKGITLTVWTCILMRCMSHKKHTKRLEARCKKSWPETTFSFHLLNESLLSGLGQPKIRGSLSGFTLKLSLISILQRGNILRMSSFVRPRFLASNLGCPVNDVELNVRLLLRNLNGFSCEAALTML